MCFVNLCAWASTTYLNKDVLEPGSSFKSLTKITTRWQRCKKYRTYGERSTIDFCNTQMICVVEPDGPQMKSKVPHQTPQPAAILATMVTIA